MVEITQAVIPAAGLSSRMYPFTKVESKLMLPIVSKPVTQLIMEELASAGIKEVIIVSNHTEKLKQFFKKDEELTALLKRMKRDSLIEKLHHVENIAKVELIRQEEPRGWMHEVWHARKYLKKGPFAVCFSDVLWKCKIPAMQQVIGIFKKTGKNVRAPARFVLKPVIFDILKDERYELGKDIVDVDVFEKLRQANDLVGRNIVGDLYSTGDPLSYLKAQAVFGLMDKEIKEEYKKFLKKIVK